MEKESWGSKLAQARRAAGLTQEQLAERLNVSRQAVTKWECGAAQPGPANMAALKDCLGDFGQVQSQTAPPQEEKKEKSYGIPMGLGLLAMFCAISLYTYVYAAIAGLWLLGLTAVSAVVGVAYAKVQQKPIKPLLLFCGKAVLAVLTALAGAAIFAWFVWLTGADYRVDLVTELPSDALQDCPALTDWMQEISERNGNPGWKPPYVVYYRQTLQGERHTERYLLAAYGVTGEPKAAMRPSKYCIDLIWQPSQEDNVRYYLVQCSGKRNFNLRIYAKGTEKQIEIFSAAPSMEIQDQWNQEMNQLWALKK